MENRIILRALFAGMALTVCSATNAQPNNRFANVEIRTEKLTDNISVLFGRGGNIAVSHGPDGTVLIDDQFAPLTPKIQAAVKALGAQPVKYLINTHWHFDHAGGNENFGKAGALIMAHDNVRVRMIKGGKTVFGEVPPAAPQALPVVTYSLELSLHLNGDEVHAHHFPHAHTDGDSVILWRKANIIHMGDLFFHKVSLPFIDLNSGGNVLGVIKALDHVLERIDDKTKVIPGHGPMATKADLQAYHDMLTSIVGAVKKARGEGKSLAEIQAMKPAAKWDTNPKAFIKGDAFVEAVYKSLEMKKQ